MISCTIKHSLKRDPNFHHTESFLGAGRSTKDPFSIRKRGCLFRSGPVIYINGVLLVYVAFVVRKYFGFL